MSTRPKTPITVDNRRLVVTDCETNGLYGDVRILSLAFIELRRGVVYDSQSWVINPGNVRLEPSAVDVHGLTHEHLVEAESFDAYANDIVAWLDAPAGQRLTLVGHKVVFDARRLFDEFSRLGIELGPMDLLDTSRLAEAARVIPANRSLAGLLKVLDLANTAPHSAIGDAMAVAAAATEMLDRLAVGMDRAGLERILNELVTPFEPRVNDGQPTRQLPTQKLAPEHLEAHLTDLSDGRRRNAALDICLAENCEILATRMEDGITSVVQAKQVITWAFAALTTKKLKRETKGRLLRGVGQALKRVEDPAFAITTYHEQLHPYLISAKRCTKRSACEWCKKGWGVCDFLNVLRSCVDASLHDVFDPFVRPDVRRIEEFLPGYDPRKQRQRGRPREGFYGELRRNGDLDAAGYGIAKAAEVRRVQGGRDWAYALLAKGWDDGCRTPAMIEMLASMTVVDAIGSEQGDGTFDPKAPFAWAIHYIDECFAAYPNQKGAVFTRLRKRRDRLEEQLTSPLRPPRDMDKAVNLRPGHTRHLGRPPARDRNAQTNGSPQIPMLTVRSSRRRSHG